MILFLQQLLPQDLLMHKKTPAELKNDFEYLKNNIFFDGCIFCTNRVVNKHIARFQGQKNSQVVFEVSLMSKVVLIWCRRHERIFGLNFFSEEAVNVITYKRMLWYCTVLKTL